MNTLVLSGGGSHGAFQVGVLERLVETGAEFDMFCGVSVGALNASILAQHQTLADGVAQLRGIWDTINTRSVYRHWLPFSWLTGLWRPGLHSTQPLRLMVREHLKPEILAESGKKLRVGAVNLNTGRYTIFTESAVEIASAVIASAALPVWLEAATMRGDLWVDGGIRNVTPMKAALDAGATDITAVVSYKRGQSRRVDVKPNAVAVGMRAFGIMFDETVENDLEICSTYIPVKVTSPNKGLGFDAMDFSPKHIASAIQLGRDSWG